METLLEDEKADEVYALNIHLIPLSKRGEKS
jgi:hypothetical protein